MYDKVTKFLEFLIKSIQNCIVVFVKCFQAEQCLTKITKKIEQKFFSSLLRNLFKGFNCSDHQLLISRLNAYGLDRNCQYFFASHLEKRKQGIYITEWFLQQLSRNFQWRSTSSTLSPLSFSIFIYDLFLGRFKCGKLRQTNKQPPEVFCKGFQLQSRCFLVNNAIFLRTPISKNFCK